MTHWTSILEISANIRMVYNNQALVYSMYYNCVCVSSYISLLQVIHLPPSVFLLPLCCYFKRSLHAWVCVFYIGIIYCASFTVYVRGLYACSWVYMCIIVSVIGIYTCILTCVFLVYSVCHWYIYIHASFTVYVNIHIYSLSFPVVY